MSFEDARWVAANVKKNMFPESTIYFIEPKKRDLATDDQIEMLKRISPATCHTYTNNKKYSDPMPDTICIKTPIEYRSEAKQSIDMSNPKSNIERLITIVKFFHGEEGYSTERTHKEYGAILNYFGKARSLNRIEAAIKMMIKEDDKRHKNLPIEIGVKNLIADLEETFDLKYIVK